jgi:hypothetical protein
VIAASDAAALPSIDPKVQGYMIISELHRLMPLFRPGKYWGDPDSDIDWDCTSFRDNKDYPLFINDIGSWEWRPQAAYATLPNIYFAGDFCQTDVDMATMEAAVQSGILAARAIQADDATRNNATRGDPIAMEGHRLYSTTTFRAAKLALLPYAYLAVAWAAYEQDKRAVKENPAARTDGQYRLSEYALILPLQFSLDWLKSAYWLARCMTSDDGAGGGRSTWRMPRSSPVCGRLVRSSSARATCPRRCICTRQTIPSGVAPTIRATPPVAPVVPVVAMRRWLPPAWCRWRWAQTWLAASGSRRMPAAFRDSCRGRPLLATAVPSTRYPT